ncbi:Fibronectin-binding protein [Streptococcus oralis]|uniref:Fibronectin-binding protein n=1 Tax=Streptococcus oralis TaxID=1303 RepID=A0A139RNQ6_STROR|nr:DUF5979 domain-containing protein [Streptococcus oralis]KXU16338.1 Fibronectin-binding protein [Streptococcus oralis]
MKKVVEAEKPNPNRIYKIRIFNAYAPTSSGTSDWLRKTYKGIIIKENQTDEEGRKVDVVFKAGQAIVDLHAGETLKIPYMIRGTHYNVEEEKASSKGYQVSYENPDVHMVTKDMVTTVINHKLPSLSIKKEVSGVFANLLQEFDIQISVQNEGKPLTGIYRAFRGGDVINVVFSDGKATVTLKRGQNVTIENLPIGATYSVEEAPASARGYQVTYENQEGTLDADKAATVTNDKNSIPETGVDFLSSELMLGIILPLSGLLFTIFLGHLVVNRRK